jgi:hypothetical protein
MRFDYVDWRPVLEDLANEPTGAPINDLISTRLQLFPDLIKAMKSWLPTPEVRVPRADAEANEVDTMSDDDLFNLVQAYEIEIKGATTNAKKSMARKKLGKRLSRKVKHMGTESELHAIRVACSRVSTPKEAMDHLQHHEILNVADLKGKWWELLGEECKHCGGVIEVNPFDRWRGDQESTQSGGSGLRRS